MTYPLPAASVSLSVSFSVLTRASVPLSVCQITCRVAVQDSRQTWASSTSSTLDGGNRSCREFWCAPGTVVDTLSHYNWYRGLYSGFIIIDMDIELKGGSSSCWTKPLTTSCSARQRVCGHTVPGGQSLVPHRIHKLTMPSCLHRCGRRRQPIWEYICAYINARCECVCVCVTLCVWP